MPILSLQEVVQDQHSSCSSNTMERGQPQTKAAGSHISDEDSTTDQRSVFARKSKQKKLALQELGDTQEFVKMLQQQARDCSEFHRVRVIGQGTYGKVFLAIDKHTLEKVAIKRVSKIRGRFSVTVRREVAVLQKMSHPNIVKLLDIGKVTTDSLLLVFEYCDTDLQNLCLAPRGVSVDEDGKSHTIRYHLVQAHLLILVICLRTSPHYLVSPVVEVCG